MQMNQSFVYLQVNYKLRHDFVNIGVLEHDLTHVCYFATLFVTFLVTIFGVNLEILYILIYLNMRYNV